MTSDYKVLIGIDRDGTIIYDNGMFPGSRWPATDDLAIQQGVVEGLKLLRDVAEADIRLAMVSNQSGPARKKVSIEHVPRVNAYINKMLKKQGAWFDGVYFCPHVTADYAEKCIAEGKEIDPRFVKDCADRKPGIGLLEQAAREFWNCPLRDCARYVIGDRVESDMMAAIYADGKGVFVPSDVKGRSDLEEAKRLQEKYPGRIHIAHDFYAAALWIKQDILKAVKTA